MIIPLGLRPGQVSRTLLCTFVDMVTMWLVRLHVLCLVYESKLQLLFSRLCPYGWNGLRERVATISGALRSTPVRHLVKYVHYARVRTTLVLILLVTRRLMLNAPSVLPVLRSLPGMLHLMIPSEFPGPLFGTLGTLPLVCGLLNVWIAILMCLVRIPESLLVRMFVLLHIPGGHLWERTLIPTLASLLLS